MDTPQILNRLDQLERQNRALLRVGAFLSLGLLVVLCAGWISVNPESPQPRQIPDWVKFTEDGGDRFMTIVTKNGANGQEESINRIVLGAYGDESGLWCYDHTGNQMLMLGEDDKDLPVMWMGSNWDNHLFQLGLLKVGSGYESYLWDKTNKEHEWHKATVDDVIKTIKRKRGPGGK